MMKIKTYQSDWEVTKAKIHAKWSKISDAQLESFKANRDHLLLSIQTLYGITKEKAALEYKDFKDSLQLGQPVTPLKRKRTGSSRTLAELKSSSGKKKA